MDSLQYVLDADYFHESHVLNILHFKFYGHYTGQ